MARALSLDLGSKRIGVAATDSSRTLASPVTVLLRRGDIAQDHKAITEIVEEYDVDTIVVGLPLSLNGTEGRAAQLIRGELAQLQALFEPKGIAVVTHDERFTTTTAHANLRERNLNAAKRRTIVDKVAAAVLLQSWLDGEKGRNP